MMLTCLLSLHRLDYRDKPGALAEFRQVLDHLDNFLRKGIWIGGEKGLIAGFHAAG